MKRAMREELVQRYLENRMTSTEEEEFFIQVALDRDLRVELKAQQLIEKSMLKDRIVEPAEFSLLESRIQATLAASSPVAAVAVAGIGRWGGALLMLGVMTMLLMLVVPLVPLPHTDLPMLRSAEKIAPPPVAGTRPGDLLRLAATGSSGLLSATATTGVDPGGTGMRLSSGGTGADGAGSDDNRGRSTKRGSSAAERTDGNDDMVAPQTIEMSDDSTSIEVDLVVTRPKQ